MAYIDDIRKIARTKEIEDKADAALQASLSNDKSSLSGKRMIAWIAAGGGVGALAGLEPGIPGITALTQAAIDAAKSVISNDPNKQANDFIYDGKTIAGKLATDMSNALITAGAAVKSAKDLFDDVSQNDTNGNRITSQLVPSEVNAEYASKLNGIVVQDYLGNNDVWLMMNGMYRLPDGWDDPNTPPVYSGWELGKYVTNTSENYDVISEKFAALEELEAYLLAGPIGYVSASYGYVCTASRKQDGFSFVGNIGQYDMEVYLDWSSTSYPINTGWAFVRFLVEKKTCLITDPLTYCPLTAPTASSIWPTVGYGILSLINGIWTPNEHDSEIPPIYQTPQSSVRFSMGDGRYGIMKPARGGGNLLYELDGSASTNNPLPDSFGLLFRDDGTLSKFVSETEIPKYDLNL